MANPGRRPYTEEELRFNPTKRDMAPGKTVAQALAEKAAAKSAKLDPMGTDAYETAKAGGRHWGTLKNSRLLPDNLVEKSIRSLDKRIKEHLAKIADPAAWLPTTATPEAVAFLVKRKWPKEIEGFEEEQAVLQGILEERKHES